ncbi:hypothetical protein SLNWT_4047 [Streptomyces albus]|uniref:Uncharacterized protein n=1 Tax=Streptomyces albus (strain ATCC 21838 / DSM 41398 / FERM P-419 / JCM 4703 / NBRC 107858) TaxID=1081613 RepID=A0A0B5ENY6_STRA4|nr:hypothetical protein SLNWT_4047 [Streptomyces albus]AOU78734.1 hypothetical protein SLNHY_4043 [Streptomyces albus]AYN34471.1 hypothetical protein DUI70_3972 [Streptomyces albus]
MLHRGLGVGLRHASIVPRRSLPRRCAGRRGRGLRGGTAEAAGRGKPGLLARRRGLGHGGLHCPSLARPPESTVTAT